MSISDSDRRLLDESAPVAARRQRSGPLLERAPRELAAIRREAAALRRENDKLRALLAPIQAPPIGRPTHAARRQRQMASGPMRCRRCGLTLQQAALEHDQVLVFAGCCPRCDGPLTGNAGFDPYELPGADPSTYLG